MSKYFFIVRGNHLNYRCFYQNFQDKQSVVEFKISAVFYLKRGPEEAPDEN